MKPRRKKGRHREITFFSGGKQCFCKQTNKKQKEKKGLRPTAPKHTCRVASTQAQEENAEKSKTRKEERGFSKDPFSNSQTRCRKKSPGKLGKTIPTAAASRFLVTARIEPKPRHSRAPKTRQKFHKLVPAREKWEKRHFQNVLSSAAPGRFLPSKPNLVKNSNFRKNKFVRPPKIILKKFVQHRGDTTGPTQVNEAPQHKIAPKPLVFKCFASYYLLDCASKTPDQKHAQKTNIFPDRKKRPRRPHNLQNGIFEKPEKSENSEEN